MNDETITIKAEGKLPGEELAVAWINFESRRLEYMTPAQREKYLDRIDAVDQFWSDLLAPLRNLAAKLRDTGKEPQK